MFNKKGFTIIELVVVVTIISILGTIGFVSYSSYIADSRDTSRLSQISSIFKALESYRTKGFLPIPSNKVNIYASGALVAYQGYAGNDVLSAIGYQDKGVDPKDEFYFTYYLTKDLRTAQLMTLLENDITVSYNLMNQANALDYSDRVVKVYGNKLGILTESGTKVPIQELSNIISSGLDIVKTTSSYTAYLTDDSIISGTGQKLYQLNTTASCKRILESGQSRGDGIYIINPTGVNLEVFCDMTTDGGGWTLVHKTTDNQTDLAGTLDTTEGFSDWNDNSEYRLSINYWKYLSTEKAMARNIRIDGKYWDDIEEGYINSISTSAVSFSKTDTYKIFNNSTLNPLQATCTSGTYYWNDLCCARCVNYDTGGGAGLGLYGYPINAPMVSITSTSYTGSAVEGGSGTIDSSRHRLSKMGIFLR